MGMSSDILVIVLSGEHKNGRRLLESLQETNSTSFWNNSFFSAIASLRYAGFVRPSTLFVSSSPIHLEAIRSAYAKRMLKPPMGCCIVSLGDMGAIRAVQQLHFVPLSDAFCDAVAHLNRCGKAATLPSVKDVIALSCPDLAPPTHEMLVQTATALHREGLIHRVGQHLFVAPASTKTTVECQTGDSVLMKDSPPREKKGILARIFKGRTSPMKKNGGNRMGKENREEKKEGEGLPDWECQATVDVLLPIMRSPEKRCGGNRRKDRGERRRGERERREERREERRMRRKKGNSSEDDTYPTTNYGNIDDEVQRGRGGKERAVTIFPSVPIPHKARASTPIDSSDSAYSRSPSEHSDEAVDHTYVNVGREDETVFEECTLRGEERRLSLLLTAI